MKLYLKQAYPVVLLPWVYLLGNTFFDRLARQNEHSDELIDAISSNWTENTS